MAPIFLVACGGEGDIAPAAEPAAPVCPQPTWVEPPACGTGPVARASLVAGPADPGFDAALALAAERFDRQLHAFGAYATGAASEMSIPLDDLENRAIVAALLADDSAWDLEAMSGKSAAEVIGSWSKVAGAYGGAAIAADAYRYVALRDEGAACELLALARSDLDRDLDVLHLATAMTGTPGVIARGFARKDLAGDGQTETTPLFASDGTPLPAEKDNGTWREDASGQYPNMVWEDSCSRDMMIGWALGYAAAWEAIRLDPGFEDQKKERLRQDATAIARSLMQVGEQGYDLEIHDADGRVTYHGYLNENAVDRFYLQGAQSGFQGIVALGVAGAFAYVSAEPDVMRWVYDALIAERTLDVFARDNMISVDTGVTSNYSAYNMAFTSGFLAQRYLCEDGARANIGQAIATSLYARPGQTRQPEEQKQSLYDFVYASAAAGANAFGPAAGGGADEAAIARGVETLREVPSAPFWDTLHDNCDEQEIASGKCIAEDGTELDLLGYVGRGDALVAAQPVPLRIRPTSNFYWRSNPYEVNGGGDGSRLLPASDMRLAYWMARFVTTR